MYVKYSVSIYGLRKSVHFNVLGCRHCLLTCHALCRHFSKQPNFSSCLPACISFLSLCEGLCFRVPFYSVLLRNSHFGLEFWNIFRLQWVFAEGSCMVLLELRCFLCLVNFWQRQTTILFSLLWAWNLLVFVYIANVCSCKTCVLCFYWKGEYPSYHSLDSCYDKCTGCFPVQNLFSIWLSGGVRPMSALPLALLLL